MTRNKSKNAELKDSLSGLDSVSNEQGGAMTAPVSSEVAEYSDSSGMAPVGGQGHDGNYVVAAYDQNMDVSRQARAINYDMLKSDTTLKMSDAQAAVELTEARQIQNGLAVRKERARAVRMAYEVAEQEVKVSTAAYGLSTAISENEDAEDKAKHTNFATKIRKSIRADERVVLKGQAATTKNKARVAAAKIKALGENLGEPTGDDINSLYPGAENQNLGDMYNG